ncbi:MAG TPA: nuclear transport factor 2 family protein [Candidatus Kapabacteria bacterium]|jgi:ketosteroid isomerase-like protein|nr:nuclear transport factor 2 family protein [Candidatus Kapabacteria bacterium]
MKKFVLILLSFAFIFSACKEEKVALSPERIRIEKDKVLETIKAFHTAYEKKDFGSMIPTLAGEVVFFGTDSGEVITTFSDYKQKMLEQWQEYDIMKYSEPYDVFIEMDPFGNFASIIYGVQLYVKKQNYENTYQVRAARTLRREKDKWVIVSGIVSIPRSPTETQAGTKNIQQ